MTISNGGVKRRAVATSPLRSNLWDECGKGDTGRACMLLRRKHGGNRREYKEGVGGRAAGRGGARPYLGGGGGAQASPAFAVNRRKHRKQGTGMDWCQSHRIVLSTGGVRGRRADMGGCRAGGWAGMAGSCTRLAGRLSRRARRPRKR